MIKGMTGFGTSQFTVDGVKAVIEVKSLNNRYFDVNYYLPTGYNSIENKMRQIIQKSMQRGRITVSLRIIDKPAQTIVLNKNAVRAHMQYANSLKKEFKLENNLTLSDIIRLPGVLDAKETFINPDKMWPIIEKSLKQAVDGLIVMRNREGKSLSVDVSDQLKKMGINTKKISSRSKLILKEKKKILSDEEFQSFQKSNDINEELSRLDHYIAEVKKLLKSTSSVGKRIDFIAQEMQRETNTIGSKLQDQLVSNAVISMKSKIEKIREQAQNIE